MSPSISPATLITLVATIVAGEVGSTVPAARLPVACTVIEDYRRGRDLDSRWYGRAVPTAGDLAAARLALEGGCDHLPYFRFLGNNVDLQTWTRLGYIRPDDEIWTWSRGPWTAVGVVDAGPAPKAAQLPAVPRPQSETCPESTRGISNSQPATCNLQLATCRSRSVPR